MIMSKETIEKKLANLDKKNYEENKDYKLYVRRKGYVERTRANSKHWVSKAYQPIKQRLRFGSNCYVNLNDLSAWSYNWWQFVRVVNGKVVFNNYNYSSSTNKHQSTVRSALAHLGIVIDLIVETSASLSDSSWYESCVNYYATKATEAKVLRELSNRDKSSNSNQQRLRVMNRSLRQIELVSKLVKKPLTNRYKSYSKSIESTIRSNILADKKRQAERRLQRKISQTLYG